VVVPDIRFKIGEPGPSALNCVESAARFISKQPWADSSRMGIDGHSFGGYETNYLVTHSRLFAAAAEVAGATDFIGDYNGLTYGYGGGLGNSQQFVYETAQYRIGASLWQRPDLYIRNSPVLKANEVTTPLLMMHNMKDGSVPFAQAVEFYTGLRRSGKRVWLLQYDDGGHSVGGKDALDYTIRVSQFFDHYLKGALPPKWMTEGVPARMKGLRTGYELDESGREP
jgi:dipeptidyl aminopeptidase/acylaminoacyl peptidase